MHTCVCVQDRHPEETLLDQHGSLPPPFATLKVSRIALDRPLQVVQRTVVATCRPLFSMVCETVTVTREPDPDP